MSAWLPPLFVALLGSILMSCASPGPDGVPAPGDYFGWVRIADPPADATGVTRLDLTALGLRVGSGIGLGYFREQRLSVPLDCRVVLFVQNGAQQRWVEDVFGTIKEGVCSAVLSP